MSFLDMHCHVLPRIDDGAKDLDTARELLRLQQSQGASAVVATPHFYAERVDLNAYRQKAISRFEQLQEVAVNEGLPELFLGFEVLFFRDMAASGVLPELSMGKSHFLLVELPYGCALRDAIADELIAIRLDCGLTPILAHLERYASQQGFDRILSVIREGYAEAQCNAASLLHWNSRRVALKLLEQGYLRYLASDAHSLVHRPPKLEEAYAVIEKRCGKRVANRLQENSLALYAALRQAQTPIQSN